MRKSLSRKFLALGLCFALAPSGATAGRGEEQSADATIPDAGDTSCSFIKGKGNEAGPWASAPLVRGEDIRDATALARLHRPVIVYGAKLVGQRLGGVRLTGICFEKSDLSRADFRRAVGDGAAFEKSDLTAANMTGTSFRRALFEDSRLDRVDASGADLSGVHVEGGGFIGLILRNAVLRDFRMRCGLVVSDADCDWSTTPGVDARGADLTRAALNVYFLNGWKLDGAVVDRTIIQFNQIRAFSRATLRGPVILASSGYDTRAHVSLSSSEWRRLLALLWVDRPSFDCSRASTAVEHELCAPDEDGAQDRRLDALYRSVLADGATALARKARRLQDGHGGGGDRGVSVWRL